MIVQHGRIKGTLDELDAQEKEKPERKRDMKNAATWLHSSCAFKVLCSLWIQLGIAYDPALEIIFVWKQKSPGRFERINPKRPGLDMKKAGSFLRRIS